MKKDNQNKFVKGDSFVREKTGSATMINLDGRWEHDFTDDDTPAGAQPPKTLSGVPVAEKRQSQKPGPGLNP
ncbi:hypothetical protein [Desulfotomaculum copahuensis]|uniref:LAS seventeen-binding protein 3 n=1 Tax=Desulfotomaculum copahuensis TaxID=1838280 RepID=A0A1B7LE20_9FIRM|nr:hypothetical protein [Desulfotomaculum copahuensis]OAT81343.1 hypothetical protein A6M21_10705 [Desulfotomaculum copahuensis]